MITYTVADYTADDSSVEVTYVNADNLVHKRKVNIPKLSEGGVDVDYFQEILEGQLLGVIHKDRLGVITFVDPTAEPEATPESEEASA